MAEGEDGVPLADRLRDAVAQCDDIIPPSLLRAYISYARQYVFPVLTRPAAEVLRQFYLDLRAKHGRLPFLACVSVFTRDTHCVS